MNKKLQKGHIYDARVLEVYENGLRVLIIEAGIRETLRNKEIPSALHNTLTPGKELKVKVYDHFKYDRKVHYRISARLVEFDPWDPKVGQPGLEEWLGIEKNRNKIQKMEVTDLVAGYAYGEIKLSVTARISLDTYASFFGKKNIKSHMSLVPEPGDRVWGAVTQINRQKRWVEIDPSVVSRKFVHTVCLIFRK